MIEKLYKSYGRHSLVGQPITMLYIGSRVKKALKKNADRKLDSKTAKMVGKELDDFIHEQAMELWNENIEPIIVENNIPHAISEPVRKKALNKFKEAIKKKVEAGLTTKSAA